MLALLILMVEKEFAAIAEVTQVVAYQHTDVTAVDSAILELARAGKIDWITITSSATARSIARLFGGELKHSRIASLSPVTSATIAGLGYEVAAEANPYTIESLVMAIKTATLEAT